MKLTIGILLCFTIISCSNVKKYEFRGAVREIALDSSYARIEHGDIEGFMQAMTMSFPVDDKSVLKGIRVGDSIAGVLAIDDTHGYLYSVEKVGKAVMKTVEIVDRTHSLKIGQPFPDFQLINHDNKSFKLSDYSGKVVLFTFIFTRCPFPDYCMRMSGYFEKLQKLIKKDAELKGKVQLISISFDTANDTPEVMKSYSKSYTNDLSNWTFATGADSVIKQIADNSGLIYLKGENGMFDHNLSTVMIDKKGTLHSINTGNNWTPEEMIAKVKETVKQ